MNNKTYSSFEEIDNEIRLLRLEKEIDRLSLSQQVLYRSYSVLHLALVKVSNRLVHLTMVQKSTVV